jgi:hypothetical protein
VELVLLQDVQGGYGSNWYRVAKTEGVDQIKVGDRFREQGFGQGAEELEVGGIDISVVGGASRLYFIRAANATQPEVHRLGAVLLPTYSKAAERELVLAGAVSNQLTNGSASAEMGPPVEDMPESLVVPTKRRRGRPPGSRNKAKTEAEFPTGF